MSAIALFSRATGSVRLRRGWVRSQRQRRGREGVGRVACRETARAWIRPPAARLSAAQRGAVPAGRQLQRPPAGAGQARARRSVGGLVALVCRLRRSRLLVLVDLCRHDKVVLLVVQLVVKLRVLEDLLVLPLVDDEEDVAGVAEQQRRQTQHDGQEVEHSEGWRGTDSSPGADRELASSRAPVQDQHKLLEARQLSRLSISAQEARWLAVGRPGALRSDGGIPSMACASRLHSCL